MQAGPQTFFARPASHAGRPDTALSEGISTVSPLQASIWEFLKEKFVGRENATPRATIIARYNLMHPRQELSDRVFRQIVSDLVTLFKKAVCTTPGSGYFVARASRERDEAINYLKSAGSETFGRARALEEADPLECQESLF